MKKDELLTEQYRIDPAEHWRVGSIERMRGGDGYDVMAKVEAEKWHAISGWGADGWDLGDWPYVVIYIRRSTESCYGAFVEGELTVYRRSTEDRYDVAYYVEGDITIYRYPTKDEAFAAIDALAFFHWQHESASWVEGVETADDMPEHLCGPYGRDRSQEATA